MMARNLCPAQLAMTLTLYGAARSRASMVRWYLEEKGIPYTMVQLDLKAGEHRQEPFLAINPFGKVPALVDDAVGGPDGDGLKLFESGAILYHLAECYGNEFEPDGPGGAQGAAARRSLTAQWLLYANASFGPAMFLLETRPEELAHQLSTLDGLLAKGGHLLAGTWGSRLGRGGLRAALLPRLHAPFLHPGGPQSLPRCACHDQRHPRQTRVPESDGGWLTGPPAKPAWGEAAANSF